MLGDTIQLTVADVAEGPDRFGGISLVVDEKLGDISPAQFRQQLQSAMDSWQADGVRGVWLKIPINGARVIPAATELGFNFHHCACPTRNSQIARGRVVVCQERVREVGASVAWNARHDFVTMTAWLPTTENTLPTQPHHQIGVGGFVLNQNGEVLVIQEKSGLTAGLKDFWKLPGGLVDPRESISDAVVREVFEETGVRVEFGAIASIRESHASTYGGMTDLYCVCACTLDSKAHGAEQSPTPKPQEREIAASKWMPVKEFFALPAYRRRSIFSDLLRHGEATASAILASGTRDAQPGMSLMRNDKSSRRPTGSLYAVSKL